MSILEKSKNLLILAGLGPDPAVHIGCTIVPRAIIRAYSVCLMLLCVALESVLCAQQHKRGLDAVLLNVNLWVTHVSMLLIYKSLLFKSGQTIELIQFIQGVTNASKSKKTGRKMQRHYHIKLSEQNSKENCYFFQN